MRYLIGYLVLVLTFVGGGWAYAKPVINETRMLYNKSRILPFARLDDYDIAVVTDSPIKYGSFVRQVRQYTDVQSMSFGKYADAAFCNTLIVAGTPTELRGRQATIRQALSKGKNVIVCTFSDDQVQSFFQVLQFGGRATELVSTGADDATQQDMAMSIFGGLAITKGLAANHTLQTRIQYQNRTADNPGMEQKIDAIAAEAIREQAAPGMVVMALKGGKVIFEKAYGYHTYAKSEKMRVTDIFDLASVSKIVGTTPVIMHLQETGAIGLDRTIGQYLVDAKNTNKADIPLRTVLLHEAGFIPFIPFYRDLAPGDLLRSPSEGHHLKIADSTYLADQYYERVMWPEMLQSPIQPAGKYVYSDISLYVMKEVAESVTHVPLQSYIQELLFQPIGMYTAGYNPRARFAKSRIVPTEDDRTFRKVLLQGYVHDQGAAMAGGVAGHAGLFGTANDLAIFGQLLLNRGRYGGVQYFKPATVDLFTSRQSLTSRRGLGFDRYDPAAKDGYPSRLANPTVYGHTGYTGTCIWIDPKNQFVYIFLSNRVHPQVSTKLLDLNIRSRIQDVFYSYMK